MAAEEAEHILIFVDIGRRGLGTAVELGVERSVGHHCADLHSPAVLNERRARPDTPIEALGKGRPNDFVD